MQDRNTIEQDVATIRRIEAVPRILRAVVEITLALSGMLVGGDAQGEIS